MYKVIVLINQNIDSKFYRILLKREIERTEVFSIIATLTDIDECMSIAACSFPDLLILSPSESETEYRRQIDAIVTYRAKHPLGGLSDVLILSNVISEYAARRLSEATVMYQFISHLEPYQIADKLMRTYESLPRRMKIDDEKSRFIDDVKNILLKLEVYPSYTGYKYVLDAVMAIRYSNGDQLLMKNLYPAIADKYGRTGSSVERAIRLISFVAWNSGGWKSCFPKFTKRPTNHEFITVLTEYSQAG